MCSMLFVSTLDFGGGRYLVKLTCGGAVMGTGVGSVDFTGPSDARVPLSIVTLGASEGFSLVSNSFSNSMDGKYLLPGVF